MNEAGFFTVSSKRAAPNHRLSLCARQRIPCANLQRTLNIKLTSIGLFDLLDHLFFLLFCARFSRGTKRASGACSQAPRAAFLRGSQETSPFVLFLGGTANPEGVRQRTDKAEARRAAGAQAVFPISPCLRETGQKGDWGGPCVQLIDDYIK